MEFSIFNFVIGHNRKIPSTLTETHEFDLYLIVLQISRLPEGATGKVLLTTRVINQTEVQSL